MKMLNYFVVYAIRANIKNKLAEKWNKDNDIIELAGIEYTVIGLRKKIIKYNIYEWYLENFRSSKSFNNSLKSYFQAILTIIIIAK